MKRIISIFIFLSVTAVIFAQNPTAVIREITGTVEIKTIRSNNFVPAKVGDTIEKSTVISTGFRSTAVLAIGNSVITMNSLTRLSLEELMSQQETETISINLNTGRVRAEVSPPAGSRADFTVQAPSSTASVRGTIFEMDTVNIRVVEGSVSYAPSSGQRPVNVNAGQESSLTNGAVLTPMAVMESSISLPNLPGQSGNTSSNNNQSGPPTGTINVEVELFAKSE